MLLNTKLFNTGLLNGGATLTTFYSTDYVVFEGFSLADNVNSITSDILYNGPTVEIQGGNIPRDNGMFVTARYFRENSIEVKGYLKAATGAAMSVLMDTIRKSLRKREGNLDITDFNGTAKRFVATVNNYDKIFANQKGYHVTIVPFDVVFVCKKPFGRSRTYSSVVQAITSSPTNIQTYHAGTIAGYPVITLNFDSASSVTVVNVTNITTGEQIQYTGTIATSDILIFDSEQKFVTKNSTQVNYSGSFPSMDVGGNLFAITITGTSFNAYTTITWKTTYL